MAKGKGKQSPSSQRWHGGVGQKRKNARVEKSSKGKFKTVAELEEHRMKQPNTGKPRWKDVAERAAMDDVRLVRQFVFELEGVRLSTPRGTVVVNAK